MVTASDPDSASLFSPPPQYMTDVQLREIRKSFGSRTLLDGLQLDVPSGQYWVLLGASGCGKTTTLKLIAGLLQPDRGEVHLGGQDVTRLAPRRRGVAMVFQNDALYPHLTLRRSLAFALGRRNRAAVRQRVEQAAQWTGIGPLLDRLPGGLSGGELRRAAVAKAIVRRAPLRLFDEPLSALDAPIRDSLQRDLLRLHSAVGGTTIHVTHDGHEAMRMADRIAVLHGGRIVQCAAPAEIYHRPAHREVARSIGTPPINLIPAGTDQTAGAVPLDEVRFGHPGSRRPLQVGIRSEALRPIERDASERDATDLGGTAGPMRCDARGVTLEGQIEQVRPVESRLHVEMRVAGETVTATLSPDQPLEIGARCQLFAPADRVWLFDTASGQRIDRDGAG